MADQPGRTHPERLTEDEQFSQEEQEAIETRMLQLFGDDWQSVLETLEVNSILFVR